MPEVSPYVLWISGNVGLTMVGMAALPNHLQGAGLGLAAAGSFWCLIRAAIAISKSE